MALPPETVSVHRVSEIDWDKLSVIRGGVIPYAIKDDIPYFCLAIDKQSKELGDFGGGLKCKLQQPLAETLREFREESKGCSGETHYQEQSHDDSIILVSRCLIQLPGMRGGEVFYSILLFHQVEASYLTDSEANFSAFTAKEKDEVMGLQWVTREQFLHLLRHHKEESQLYRPTCRIIAQGCKSQLLLELLGELPPKKRRRKNREENWE